MSFFRNAAIAECGTAAARVATFKQRLYKGAQLPSEIVELFALARYYRKRQHDALGARARKFWMCAAENSKSTAVSMAETYMLRFRETLLSNLQREMRIDPHQSHAFLSHIRGAELSNCADPNVIPAGPDNCPPLLSFSRSCRNIVTQTAPCPPAATSPSWLSHIFHTPGGGVLMRNFTASELYPFLFPPSQRFKFKPCHVDCRICRQYAAELRNWRPRESFPTMPVPHHRGSLHTSRGADLNDLVAELIRWVRPEDFQDIFDYRLAVCSLLSNFFNRMLSSGSVPEGDFTRCVTSPLYKSVKHGARPPPRWDADAYRFIPNSSLFAKAFSTILASRLAHWAIRTGLLSEQQVAFLPFRGVEEHVFSLQQIARDRARHNQQTYLLFVDYAKAYDTIHLDALWKVLEVQGVPLPFIALLRDWSSKRTTQVRVNGELSEPFRMSKGVPQGDPLSCLLFDLFIDSLSRMLKSRPDLPGVSAFGGGIRLQHQLYADDLVGLAETAAELQRCLNYIKQWSDAWGMSINTGVGKTEALLVDADAPGDVAAPLPPLLLDDGRVVRWTASYRYLGYPLRSDLRDTDVFDTMYKHLQYLWNVHFRANGIVRHASSAFQMQFYTTMVQGSLRNLRALTTIDAKGAKTLEKTLLGHIREIFGLKKHGAPIDLVSAIGAMLPWHAIHAQEHERLYLQLSNSIYPESIAVRVFRLAQADPRIGPSYAKRNWVRAWERTRAAYAAKGIPLAPQRLRYELIPREAGLFGRAVAFVQWQSNGQSRVPGLPKCDASAIPSYRPTEAVANLFENYQAPISSLGTFREFTPLSTHGPGCSGSTLSRSNIPAQRLGPVVWARAGAAVMSSPLFRADKDPIDYAAHARPCRLCNACPVDAFHIISECNHPIIDDWRQVAERSARILVSTLTVIMEQERDRAGRAPQHDLFRRIRRAMNSLDFDTPEGDFILYRLLLAQPWSERMACPGMHVVRLMGRAFDLDGIYHRYERPLLDRWCGWSRHTLWSLSRAWFTACEA